LNAKKNLSKKNLFDLALQAIRWFDLGADKNGENSPETTALNHNPPPKMREFVESCRSDHRPDKS
jgi:hypothetical protein